MKNSSTYRYRVIEIGQDGCADQTIGIVTAKNDAEAQSKAWNILPGSLIRDISRTWKIVKESPNSENMVQLSLFGE